MKSIFPSLMAADQLNLKRVIQDLDPYCAGYHIDIMDNRFVPNSTGGASFANHIAQETSNRIWVHLMVEDPVLVIDRLVLPADSIVSIHIEIKKRDRGDR